MPLDLNDYQMGDMELMRAEYEMLGSNLILVISAPVVGWRWKSKIPLKARQFFNLNILFEETIKFYCIDFIKFNESLHERDVYAAHQHGLIVDRLDRLMKSGGNSIFNIISFEQSNGRQRVEIFLDDVSIEFACARFEQFRIPLE